MTVIEFLDIFLLVRLVIDLITFHDCDWYYCDFVYYNNLYLFEESWQFDI
jgi:hypothetical protein